MRKKNIAEMLIGRYLGYKAEEEANNMMKEEVEGEED